ncbi:SDR family oxidoreductase [Aromatoleum toluclasticum]|uniref:SDR family oxidoreductase n=1 Tax=Aromatoleum toluclasticum TaxID=92003 RepID=UPI001D18DDFE|nr:SDR family oxidoreductase [Aromatoleum toluclasticum]MCC4115132.1 SDR family oxidoreductase [Aromatoleum toluclasticum]
MRVLILGARGFIGASLADAFTAAGHTVVKAVRQPVAPDEVAIDFASDHDPADWGAFIAGVDVLINAVGIIVETAAQRFDIIHTAAPVALFEACVAAGTRAPRVIQISALGADRGDSSYFLSKRAADEALMRLPLDWQVLRPALVFGEQGQSARLFLTLASLPLLPLPGGGQQPLQPVHIDDLTDAALRLADPATPARQCIDLAGPAPLTLRDILLAYRRALGLPPTGQFAIPAPLMTIAAAIADRIPGALFNHENWRMLQAGNTCAPDALAAATRLLGHAPRSIERFIAPQRSADLRRRALDSWHGLLLRVALAIIWFVTAIVSAGAYPQADSLALLARVGLAGVPAFVALYGAAALDFAFGVATLFRPGRRLWLAQAGLVLAYTAIIAFALPEFLVHPFGPITKNLAVLAILIVLHSREVSS